MSEEITKILIIGDGAGNIESVIAHAAQEGIGLICVPSGSPLDSEEFAGACRNSGVMLANSSLVTNNYPIPSGYRRHTPNLNSLNSGPSEWALFGRDRQMNARGSVFSRQRRYSSHQSIFQYGSHHRSE